MANYISLEIQDRIARMTLQSDEKNTITHPFLDQFKEHMQTVLKSEARCVLLDSHSNKFFSNGFHPDVFLDQPAEAKTGIMEKLVRLGVEQFTFDLPMISCITGYAAGGGAFIAAFCDFRIMSRQKSRLGFTEVELAMTIPSTALEILNHRIGLQNSLQTILTGKMMGAEECFRYGLVDEVADTDEEARKKADALAARLASLPRESLISLKRGALRSISTEHMQDQIVEDMKEVARLMMTPACEAAFAALKAGKRPKHI